MANKLDGPARAGVIAFLSDFGHSDPYVGICHGVMLRFAPHVRIVDVCHEIPPGNIRVGAAMLAQAAPYLPPGVIVAVVDPGVGTDRRAIVITAGDSVLVGPDNGLLIWAAEALGGAQSAHEITNPDLILSPLSRTFHGRDVFSPVAGRLISSLPVAAVGPALAPTALVRLPDPVVRTEGEALDVEVLTIDRYGNLQTAAPGMRLRELLRRAEPGVEVLISAPESKATAVYGETFGSVSPGQIVVYEDSAGFVAIAVNGGRAQERLGVTAGSVIRLSPTAPNEPPPRRPP